MYLLTVSPFYFQYLMNVECMLFIHSFIYSYSMDHTDVELVMSRINNLLT